MKKLTNKSKKILWWTIGITSALIVIPTVIVVPILALSNGNKPQSPPTLNILDTRFSKWLFTGPWENKTELTPADFKEYDIREIGFNAFTIKEIKNLKKIIIPADSNLIIRYGGLNSHSTIEEIIIPDIKMNIEWKSSSGRYGTFGSTNPNLIVHMPERYRHASTPIKLGLVTHQFDNIEWYGIYDTANQDPI